MTAKKIKPVLVWAAIHADGSMHTTMFLTKRYARSVVGNMPWWVKIIRVRIAPVTKRKVKK